MTPPAPTPEEQAAAAGLLGMLDHDTLNWREVCDAIAKALATAHARGRAEAEPAWQELYEAAFDFGTYDDLTGDLCEHCKPEQPEAFIAARARLADAIDVVEALRALADRGEQR